MKTMTISKYTLLATAFALAACSITLSDVTPGPTSGHVTEVATVDSAPTQAGVPTVGIIQTSTPGVTPLPASVPWADLNLTGSLIYTQGKLGLFKLNLVTGEKTILLAHNEKMWLSAQATSPDGKTIIVAYSPPPSADQVQLGYTGLYQIASDGSTATPIPVLPQTDPQESYFNPVWTPDGKYIYYAHFVPVRDTTNQGNTFKYTIERMAFPDGKPEVILQDAIWPKISPDGTKLLYLKFDTVQYTQLLYTSDLDGQNPTALLPNSDFPSVDAQFYSNDGKTIIFNAVGEGQAPAFSWLDRLMGINAVDAHNVPSDWWSITEGQDKPVRLTKLYDTGMYGDFSPDGQYVAFLAASGMYVMTPDGTLIKPLVDIKSLGTLEWVP
jgi:Tol biopolymer transport system component